MCYKPVTRKHASKSLLFSHSRQQHVFLETRSVHQLARHGILRGIIIKLAAFFFALSPSTPTCCSSQHKVHHIPTVLWGSGKETSGKTWSLHFPGQNVTRAKKKKKNRCDPTFTTTKTLRPEHSECGEVVKFFKKNLILSLGGFSSSLFDDTRESTIEGQQGRRRVGARFCSLWPG